MSWASSEAVTILSFLLPGLVAVAVFHMFTSHPRPSEFERIVQALIFTILVQAIAELALWVGRALGHDALWGEESEIMVSVGIALILGMIAVYFSNTDTLHRFVRLLRLTKETSYPSEWYSAFHHNLLIATSCCICMGSAACTDGLRSGRVALTRATSESPKVSGWWVTRGFLPPV